MAGEVSVAEVGVEEQQRLVGGDVHGDLRHEIACGQGPRCADGVGVGVGAHGQLHHLNTGAVVEGCCADGGPVGILDGQGGTEHVGGLHFADLALFSPVGTGCVERDGGHADVVAVGEVGAVLGDAETAVDGKAFTAGEVSSHGSGVDALVGLLMVVHVGEIVDDFAGRLEDLPIQPRNGRHRHGLRIPEPVGEFVGLMDVDVRRLGAHRFEFLVGLDGQQTLGVPEALVVGVPGGDRGRGGQHEGTHEDALCVGLGQPSTDGFDEEHPGTKVQHNPEQDARHQPWNGVEHLGQPRWTCAAQEIAMAVQFAEVGPVFAVQLQEDVDRKDRDEPDVGEVDRASAGVPRVLHRALLTAAEEGRQGEDADGDAGEGGAPPRGVPGEHGLVDDGADGTRGHGELREVFAPSQVAVGEQHVPVGEHEASLGVGVGCTVEGRRDEPSVEQQHGEHGREDDRVTQHFVRPEAVTHSGALPLVSDRLELFFLVHVDACDAP